MDLNIIFNKTAKASRAPLPWVGGLSSQSKRVLSLVDGKQNVQNILRQSENQPQNEVLKILHKLEIEGYIQRLSTQETEPEWLKSLDTYGVNASSMVVEEIDTTELNFSDTKFSSTIPAETKEENNAKAKREKERKAKVEAAEKVRIEALEQAKRIAEAETKARQEVARVEREKAEAAARAKAEEDARLQAEAERRAKTEAEEQARIKAERKAQEEADKLEKIEAERKAQEALAEKARQEAEEQARLEAERIEREQAEAAARAKAEEDARLQEEAERRVKTEAEEQARIEAERKAQEGAAEQARLEAERIAREEEKARHAAEKKAMAEAEKAARKESKRLAKKEKAAKAKLNAEVKARTKEILGSLILNNWNPKLIKPLLIATSAAAVLILVLIHFVNLSMLIKPVEELATNSIGEPVKVQEVHASLFPVPHLILNNIVIGKDADIKISTASMRPDISTLFGETKVLKSLEVTDLTLRPTDLGRQAQWINTTAKSDKLKIEHIALKHITFNIPGLELEPFDGKLTRTPSGELSNVELVNAGSNITLLLTPQNGSCAVTFTASAWQPPLFKHLELDEVTATGIVSQNQADFSQIEAKAYGGIIRAQGVVNWVEHVNASGNFVLSKITLPRLLSAYGSNASIDGKLNASAAFASKVDQVSALVEDAEVNSSFEVLNGKINGVALSQAVMAGPASKPAPEANFTRFDTLTGNLLFRNGQYKYKQFELKTEQFHAYGSLDIESNQIISGKVSAALTSKSLRRQASFNLSGKVPDVKLQ